MAESKEVVLTVPENTIYTGLKFFGRKIYLEPSGDKQIDTDLKKLFKDDYVKTAPLEMMRPDVKRVLAWCKVARRGQQGLFNEQKGAKE